MRVLLEFYHLIMPVVKEIIREKQTVQFYNQIGNVQTVYWTNLQQKKTL